MEITDILKILLVLYIVVANIAAIAVTIHDKKSRKKTPKESSRKNSPDYCVTEWLCFNVYYNEDYSSQNKAPEIYAGYSCYFCVGSNCVCCDSIDY